MGTQAHTNKVTVNLGLPKMVSSINLILDKYVLKGSTPLFAVAP